MNSTAFETFKSKYLKEEVIEYPNLRKGKVPLVTVRVIVYNHVNFLDDCLHSILNQQVNFDYEILIAEDESNDGSREKCIEYAQKYPEKIRLLLNSRKNNISIKGRPSGLFNSVYSNFMIHSKYIALCEADDYWTANDSLQQRVDFLETHNDYVLCFHNAIRINEEKKDFHQSKVFSYKKSTSFSKGRLLKTTIPTASLMFRHKLISLFDDGMKTVLCGDYILRGKLSLHGKGMYLHSISPSIRRIHKGGCFSTIDKMEQVMHKIEAGKYLKTNYKGLTWMQKSISTSLAELHITAFYREIKDYNFSFNHVLSSVKISKNFLNWFRVTIIFLLKKLRNNVTYKSGF